MYYIILCIISSFVYIIFFETLSNQYERFINNRLQSCTFLWTRNIFPEKRPNVLPTDQSQNLTSCSKFCTWFLTHLFSLFDTSYLYISAIWHWYEMAIKKSASMISKLNGAWMYLPNIEIEPCCIFVFKSWKWSSISKPPL